MADYCELLERLKFPQIHEIRNIEPWNLPPSSNLRIAVIKFLLDLVVPQWETMRIMGSRETVEKRMAYVSSLLGLCQPDDVSVIRGLSSIDEQETFFRLLIDLALTYELVPDNQELERISNRDSAFLQRIILEHSYRTDENSKHITEEQYDKLNRSIFRTQLSVFPPDIQLLLNPLLQPPNENELQQQIIQLDEQIENVRNEYNQLYENKDFEQIANILPPVSNSNDYSQIDQQQINRKHYSIPPLIDIEQLSMELNNDQYQLSELSITPNYKENEEIEDNKQRRIASILNSLNASLSELRSESVGMQEFIQTELFPYIRIEHETSPIGEKAQQALQHFRIVEHILDVMKSLKANTEKIRADAQNILDIPLEKIGVEAACELDEAKRSLINVFRDQNQIKIPQ
ncbi:MAG: hypothetical protein EZS28_006101 [Streblomastix strix]|uniref:Uncharacterized protein n=1 Tax=Streblomastix strix TaxID=222440 RepID=A0A5J4WVX3_9EUKA|nr:MAG: hypothetical protein EZS28_006101 [Streblomastix strix]